MSTLAEQSPAGRSRDRPPPATLELAAKAPIDCPRREPSRRSRGAGMRRIPSSRSLSLELFDLMPPRRVLRRPAGRPTDRWGRRDSRRRCVASCCSQANNNINSGADSLGQRRARTAAVATSQQPAAQPGSPSGSRLDYIALVFARSSACSDGVSRPNSSKLPSISCCLHFSLKTSAQATVGLFPAADGYAARV